MTRLERRYRMLLRTLPRWYRHDREEEMVATDRADRADRVDQGNGEDDWPGWPEMWSTAGLALRARLAATDTPRAQALGHAIRLAALLGLFMQSALALAGLERTSVTRLTEPAALSWSWPQIIGTGRLLVMVASLVLVVLARYGWAKLSAVLATLPGLIPLTGCTVGTPALLTTCGEFPNAAEAGVVITDNLPLWITVGCLFIGFRREAVKPKGRPWLLALVLAAQAVFFVELVTVGERNWDLISIPAWAVCAAGLTYLTLAVTRRLDKGGPWAVALAVSAAATLPAQYEDWHSVAQWPTALAGWMPLTLVDMQFGVTALVVLVMAMVAFRAFRHTRLADLKA